MRAPHEGIRREVAQWSSELRELPDDEAEAGLAQLLDHVLESLEAEAARDDEDLSAGEASPEGEDALAAVEAWASLVSYAITNVYAPMSPLPRGLAGFSKGAVRRLRKAARALHGPLARAQQAIGATSFSISVGFPWGVSVGLSW